MLIPADVTALIAPTIAALNAYPFFTRIAGFGVERDRGKLLGRSISVVAPLHPRKAFEKLSSARIRIDPVAFAKEGGDGTRYSQTEQALGAHTDSSYLEDPHELVAFQMAVPDPAGGETLMVAAADVVSVLDEPVRARLAAPVFPFGSARYPILSGRPGDPKIRYYRRQIDESAAVSEPLGAEDIAALDALDAALARPELQTRFRLEAGEIVLMNNLRVLHGRTGMDTGSERLMYRVRAWAGCLL